MVKTDKIIDDPTVREIYSNRVASASYDGAVVTVSLACTRNVPGREGEVVINNRWCIPETVAVELHRILSAAMERMLERKTGAPSAEPAHVTIKPKPH